MLKNWDLFMFLMCFLRRRKKKKEYFDPKKLKPKSVKLCLGGVKMVLQN